MSKKYLILVVFLFLVLMSFVVYKAVTKNREAAAPQTLSKFLKGIVYSPYYPGEIGGEILPDDGRYKDHLIKIQELGANTVSVFPEKMPSGFFDALEGTNLSYIPIININLYDGTDNSDLLGAAYQEKVLAHIKEIIDYNYSVGRPELLTYFVLGYEINPAYIINTNNLHSKETSFSGKFLSLENRLPAEIALAKLLDAAMSYELERYGKRHLYAHISFPAYGFLRSFGNSYEFDKNSFFPDFFDVIAINLYPSYFYPAEDNFIAYLESLSKLSTKPIIISEFGLSTAPGVRDDGVPTYEDGSDRAAAKLFNMAAKQVMAISEIKGLFFFEFMDEYWKNGGEVNDDDVQNPNDSEEWFGLYSVSLENDVFVLKAKPEINAAIKNIFKSDNSYQN